MNPEEPELRRALDARSGAPSPEFMSRLGHALGTRPAVPNLMPAIALATVVVLTATSVAILVGARHLGRGSAASGARATSPTPIPAGGFKFQLSVPSASVVWALYDPDKLYRSTDGGTSWQVRSLPSEWGVHPVISFISDKEGWWLAPGSPTTQCEQAEAAIWHTIDGGASWQRLPAAGIGQSQCKDGIWFFDSKHGLMSAHDPNHRPTVYRTSDGGNTWAATTMVDPAYFKSSAGGFTLQVLWMKQFGATLYLEAFGSQDDPNLPHDNQFVLRSTDEGAAWSLVTKVPSRSVVMVTESRWLDFSSQGQAMESTNGGQQYHQFASNYVADPANDTQFVFADSEVGFAAGRGHLQRTTDGGVDWTRLAPPGLGNVKGSPSPTPSLTPSPSQSPGSIPMPTEARISAPSPDVVWALVAGQRLFRSTDQGLTWQERNPPAGSHFSDVSFVDESDGWVLLAGPDGTQCSFGGATVWQTTDAGASWNIVSQINPPPASGARSAAGAIGPVQCKENISFVDKQRGFLDAWDENGAPTIYRTFDGGVTWSSSKLPDTPGFHTLGAGDTLRAGPVKAFGATLLVAASGMQPDGPHTYAFQSTDGGGSWTYVSTIPATATTNFVFATATRWLILNNDGSGQETLDAGKTWHAFTSDDNDAAGVASAFVFVDGRVGYGTVRGGIRLTTDGGSHWSLIKTSWP